MDSAIKELTLQSTSLGFVSGIKEAIRIIDEVEMAAAVAGNTPTIGRIKRLLLEAAEKEASKTSSEEKHD